MLRRNPKALNNSDPVVDEPFTFVVMDRLLQLDISSCFLFLCLNPFCSDIRLSSA